MGVAGSIEERGTSRPKGKECQMLVLSRCKDESIMVGDDVEVVIINVRGNKVRLGITAPKHIPVHRKEVYEAIHRQEMQKTK
jgi:carbon storage regulator